MPLMEMKAEKNNQKKNTDKQIKWNNNRTKLQNKTKCISQRKQNKTTKVTKTNQQK